MTLSFGGEDLVVASGHATLYNCHKFKGSLTFTSPKINWLNMIVNFGMDLTGGETTLLDVQVGPNSIHQFQPMSLWVGGLQNGHPTTLAFKVYQS